MNSSSPAPGGVGRFRWTICGLLFFSVAVNYIDRLVIGILKGPLSDKLGSIDANRGDELLGWDTDQFPTDIYLTTQTMLVVLGMGGFKSGGLNFDAKVRRESFEPVDLFHAHIGGMDAFARGLKIAAAIRKDGRLARFVKERYASWDKGIGRDIEKGKVTFKELEAYMFKKGEADANASGRQEMLENIINEFI